MSVLAEVFSYSAFVHAISGATGGSLAMTTFYPLDVIRTHQQVQKNASISKLIKKEGVEVLYRGLQATLVSLYASNFVFFYANNLLKVLYKKASGKEVDVLKNLLVASLAGIVNVLVTCPLWVANTRLKLQSKNEHERKYTGLIDCIQKLSKEEGWPVLWSGVGASLILVSNAIINHVVYDSVKSIFVKRAQLKGLKSLAPIEIFMAGAIAKAVATIMTYPIQLAQSRQRHGGGGHTNTKSSSGGPPPSKTIIPPPTTKREEEEGEEVPQRGSPRGGPPLKTTNYNTTTLGDREEEGEEVPHQSRPPRGGPPLKPTKLETNKNMLMVLYQVYCEDGILGFFAGLRVKLLQTVLTAAFHFLCYEQIKNLIFQVMTPRKTLV